MFKYLITQKVFILVGEAPNRSLPERQKPKAVDLIAALRSAFNAAEEECREVRAHGAMLELRRRKDEPSAKYTRRAHRISDRIDPKYDSLLAIKLRDGFRSKSLKRHLSVRDVENKTTFEMIYKRFLDIDRFEKKKRNNERFDSFSSSDSSL